MGDRCAASGHVQRRQLQSAAPRRIERQRVGFCAPWRQQPWRRAHRRGRQLVAGAIAELQGGPGLGKPVPERIAVAVRIVVGDHLAVADLDISDDLPHWGPDGFQLADANGQHPGAEQFTSIGPVVRPAGRVPAWSARCPAGEPAGKGQSSAALLDTQDAADAATVAQRFAVLHLRLSPRPTCRSR